MLNMMEFLEVYLGDLTLGCFPDAKLKIAYPFDLLKPRESLSKPGLVNFVPNLTNFNDPWTDFKITVYAVVAGPEEFFTSAYELAKDDDAVQKSKV